MHIRNMLGTAAVLATLAVSAQSADTTNAEVEELEQEESSKVSAEFSIAFDSKYVNYGFVDQEPILTPDASLTFFDILTFGAYAIFDLDTYGAKRGYTDRQGKYVELHPYITLSYALSPDDFGWLPTTIELELGYDYEYHPRSKAKGPARFGDEWDKSWCEDTQFWNFTVTLPDLWVEPKLWIEQDVVRDHGLYANLELGHTFDVIGEGDNAVLTFRPSVAQGYGNRQRVAAYAEKYNHYTEEYESYSHPGLMDTRLKGEFTWNICDHVSFSAYLAYYDFLFDGGLRGCERDYARYYDSDRGRNTSWEFVAGCALTVSF